MEGIEGLPDYIGLLNKVDDMELRLNFGDLYG
jgi:hypothetical protein